MIRNEKQLALVREQLDRAEKALKCLSDEVRPKSEVRFLLMAESYVEMIQQLRGEIETYLGMESVMQLQADLILGLEGRDIQLGNAPVSLVTRTIDAFRRGLQSLVDAAASDRPAAGAAGRQKRWIMELCDLPLVGIVRGSVQIQLGEPTSLSSNLLEDENREFYEQVIGLLRNGLACATGESSADQLPEKLRQPVLNAVRKLVPAPRGTLEAITVSGRAIGLGKHYRVTREARARLDQEVRRNITLTAFTSVAGIMREIDLDQNTFVLRDRPEGAPELPCEYAEIEEEDVKTYLDKRVRVSGNLRTSPKAGRQTMDVEVIEGEDMDEGERQTTC